MSWRVHGAFAAIQVHSEEEITRILPIARKHGVPVTFRAAGTSLSGQAITDSVLLKLSHTGKNFRKYEIHVSIFFLHPYPISGDMKKLFMCS